jgi:hypothetical protein
MNEEERATELLLVLVRDEQRCMQLLEALNKAARQVDSYEYGLPLYDESHRARFRELLYRWVSGSL